jgi:hypothetical protein
MLFLCEEASLGRSERAALIRQIEELRRSKVVAYVLSDRPPTGAVIGDDAVRPMHEHLRALEHVEKLDLFIYSRGGAIDVPWRLATALRNTADEWNILVPFRANSAATLLALGADEIVLGHQGELGPIDPAVDMMRPGPNGPIQDSVRVEDVMAYTTFVKERSGLTDEVALAGAFIKLLDRLDAVSLGNAYRTYQHIRYVARRMLSSRNKERALPEEAIDRIVETLAERVYAHGHAIGLSEAQEMELPVFPIPAKLDSTMWALLGEYERDMKLLEPLDVHEVVRASDRHSEQCTIGMIETTWGLHEFSGNVEVTAKRQMPPALQVSLNMPLMLPPSTQAGELPAALQQMLQQAQQTLVQNAQQAIQDALRQQAPVVDIEVRVLGGRWRRAE